MTYTLITGASAGIGTAFATALAGEGRNLILTARSADRLEALRRQLSRPGLDIRTVAADLARGGAQTIQQFAETEKLGVDLLINNAGLGSGGRFDALPLGRELEMVATNIAAVVVLSHWALGAMRARGGGAVINVASTAGFQPVPHMATYAATKAFVLSFSQAVGEENRAAGVHVMALCPGPTQTNFFNVAGTHPRRGGMQTAEEVVQLALAGLRARKRLVVCGWRNRGLIAAERLLPRGVVIRAAAGAMKAEER